MEFQLADRLSNVSESATLKMAVALRAVTAKGHRVVNFSVGEPHFPVPESVRKAGERAIDEGFNRYTPVPGIPELRNRISEKLRDENGLDYSSEQIIVAAGVKQALFNLFQAVLNPGDEVLVPVPYWTSYPEMVKLAGARPVFIPSSIASGFKVSAEAIRSAITKRTKILLLNSPNNPSGAVYSKQEYKEIAEVLRGTSVLVCSDEIYEYLTFLPARFVSFASVSQDAFNRTVTVNGFSKAYAMTGWRLGYAAGPKKIVSAMQVIQGQSTSGANCIAQKAGLAALELGSDFNKGVLDSLTKSRAILIECLGASPLLSFSSPSGAFYLWLNIEKCLGKKTPLGVTLSGSEDLAYYLLNEAHVGTVPGSGFGMDKYLRLSFAVSESEIQEGCTRILRALAALK